MVSVLIWLLVALVVVGLVMMLNGRSRQSTPDGGVYRAMVDLHRIRRRFDVAQLKFESRRDGADARRELRAELDEFDGES